MPLTEEQLQEALKSDVVKKHVEDAITAATDSLKSNRDDLLGKFKKQQDENKEFQARLDAIEGDKRKAEAEAAAASGDIDKIKASMQEDFNIKYNKLEDTNKGLQSQLNNLVINNGLTQALVKANVKPEMMGAVEAMLLKSTKAEIGDNDGKLFAKFDGKAVEDFVTTWAQSDEGKHFVSADNNGGGGSNGANGSGKAASVKTMSREDFTNLPAVEQMNVSKEGVTLTD